MTPGANSLLGVDTMQNKTLRSLLRRLILFSLAVLLGESSLANTVVLDDFEDVSGWSAITSEGIDLEIAQDEGREGGMAMRLDFDFHGGGGYAIAHKALSIPLPENYAFTFHIRGDAPQNNLEFKLVDPSGMNVWWQNRRDFEFPTDWKRISIKKRHLEFAWGPNGDAELKEVATLELAISAGTGGRGSIWIDQLSIEPREPPSAHALAPVVRASTTADRHELAAVFDGDSATSWKSGALAEDQWLLIDFHKTREYGGLVIDWDGEDFARDYAVQISDDGKDWQGMYTVTAGNGGRDYVYLPDVESRYLRVNLTQSSRGNGYGIKAIEVKPYEFSASANHFFGAVAGDSLAGAYPRYFLGQQTYWTVVGAAGDDKEALMNEDGMVEVDQGHFSIEPFVYLDGRLLSWKDVRLNQELEEAYLPIPSVSWSRDGLQLKVTALAAGQAGDSSLYLRYRLHNETLETKQGRLFLALRPFQVIPPWQSLNMLGGVGGIQALGYDGASVFVDKDKPLTHLTKADGFGAARFTHGGITEYLRQGKLPKQTELFDDAGYASGALEFRFELPPGGMREIYLVVPFHQQGAPVQANLSDEEARRRWDEAFEATRDHWFSLLNRVAIGLPPSDKRITDTLRTTLAHILINNDGPAIQPGSRAYARSWIRDGSLIAAALLHLGHPENVHPFIRWYARFQSADGRVPCCVDWRGADPVVENDSDGQWIYLLMEYYRYSHDIGLLIEMWPHVIKAAEHIDALRQQRMTEDYRSSEKRLYYGLLPESISHEGYSSRPVHSYWDNLFALRGLKDASSLAMILGEDELAATFARSRDAFRKDLYASMNRSITHNEIAYIPGAAELGDFDFTATVIAVDPVGELPNLPEPAFAKSFEEYYAFFQRRKAGNGEQDKYTPYEIRIVAALVQMGLKDLAHELLDFFFTGQRPGAWNQWAEVVWHDRHAPGFIGDMPHTWVGAEYVRSVRSLFAFERESDQALVIGAGLTHDWVTSEEGVTVKRLPTYYGTLNYAVRKQLDNGIAIHMSGDVTVPPGKIVIASPLTFPLKGVTVNGKAIDTFTASEAVVSQFPAEVVLHYEKSVEPRAVVRGPAQR